MHLLSGKKEFACIRALIIAERFCNMERDHAEERESQPAEIKQFSGRIIMPLTSTSLIL